MLRPAALSFATLLVFGEGAFAQAPAPSSERVLYRIETGGSGVVWATDPPRRNGASLTFHGHPQGTLMSLREGDVSRISAVRVVAAPSRAIASAYIDVGETGGAGRAPVAGSTAPARSSPAEPAGPGARRDGTALLNPDRKYQPDVDSKQVPGLNIGLPNSLNDYREGRTIGYPAAPATQSAPGEPPRMPQGTGEVPKAPG